MISRLISHLRGNAIAYVALFVALGGTSYAATSLPRNSVGTQQLRNGAVTSSKLSGGLGAQVWGVVTVSGSSGAATSYPKGVRVKYWHVTSTSVQGLLVLPHRWPKACVPLATDEGPSTLAAAVTPSVSVSPLETSGELEVYADSINEIAIAIVCPRAS